MRIVPPHCARCARKCARCAPCAPLIVPVVPPRCARCARQLPKEDLLAGSLHFSAPDDDDNGFVGEDGRDPRNPSTKVGCISAAKRFNQMVQ